MSSLNHIRYFLFVESFVYWALVDIKRLPKFVLNHERTECLKDIDMDILDEVTRKYMSMLENHRSRFYGLFKSSDIIQLINERINTDITKTSTLYSLHNKHFRKLFNDRLGVPTYKIFDECLFYKMMKDWNDSMINSNELIKEKIKELFEYILNVKVKEYPILQRLVIRTLYQPKVNVNKLNKLIDNYNFIEDIFGINNNTKGGNISDVETTGGYEFVEPNQVYAS